MAFMNECYYQKWISGQIMIEFVGLRAKTYSYLIDDDSEEKNKKANSTKKCVIKKNLSLKMIKAF